MEIVSVLWEIRPDFRSAYMGSKSTDIEQQQQQPQRQRQKQKAKYSRCGCAFAPAFGRVEAASRQVSFVGLKPNANPKNFQWRDFQLSLRPVLVPRAERRDFQLSLRPVLVPRARTARFLRRLEMVNTSCQARLPPNEAQLQDSQQRRLASRRGFDARLKPRST